MKSYTVKLEDRKENSNYGYILRKTNISVGGKTISGPYRIPKHPIKKYNLDGQLNEINVNLTLSDIEKGDDDNKDLEPILDRKFLSKIKKGAINIAFVSITRTDKTGFVTLKEKVEQISDFVVDLIFKNPFVDVVTLPMLYPDEHDSYVDAMEVNALLSKRVREITNLESGDLKVASYIPHYLPRNRIPSFIEEYVSIFGSRGIFIPSVDGHTFSSIGYGKISQIEGILERQYKEENYSLYLYSHKDKRQTVDEEIPAEDFLAMLRESSIIGPSHKRRKFPKELAMAWKMEDKLTNKTLNEDDLLFYHHDKSPVMKNLKNWAINNGFDYENSSNKKRNDIMDLYNDHIASSLVSPMIEDTDYFLKNLKRDTFVESLRKFGKNKQSSLF